MSATDEVRRFAFRQGPGQHLLEEQRPVDDAAPTTSRLPPPRARTGTGVPLPHGTHDLLGAARYPSPCPVAVEPSTVLGHVLQAAFGLQRREPSHSYDDHRSVASGRAKYPVHAFIVHGGRARYFDAYRLALVDVDVPALDDPVRGRATVILAARYTDLPEPYGRLRFTVCETELGVNLRALCVAAELFGVPARPDLGGTVTRWAADLVRSTGPGAWSAPVVVHLDGLCPAPAGGPLPGSVATAGQCADDPPLTGTPELWAVSRHRLDLPAAPVRPARAVPADRRGASASTWAEVLWNRSAGRVPQRRYGFSLQPSTVDDETLADLIGWAAQEPPHALLADLAGYVSVRYVLNGAVGRPPGVYTVEDGEVRLVRPASGVLAALERGFGRPSSPTTDIGLRHACVVSVLVADAGALVTRFGPAALSLLQIWCGWSTHGLCLAASAHGLIARPARSFDEYHLQHLLRLSRKDIPVFMTVCGRSRFTELMLDLRP